MKNKNTPNFAKASLGTQKGFSTLLALLLFIVLVGSGLYLYTEKTSKEMPEVNLISTTTQKENIIKDKGSFNSQEEQTNSRIEMSKTRYFQEKGLSFTLKSEYIDSSKFELPLQIGGAVTDETEWNVFEGEAGVVEIYGVVDGEEKKIASLPITLPGFYKNTNKSRFYFDLMVGDRQWMSSLDNENGYILFKEVGVKDTDGIDFIKVPILFDIPKT